MINDRSLITLRWIDGVVAVTAGAAQETERQIVSDSIGGLVGLKIRSKYQA